MGKNGGKWGISQSVYPIPHKINSPFFPIGSPRDRSSVCHVPTNSFCSTHQNYHVWVKSDVDGKIYLSKEVLKITKRI